MLIEVGHECILEKGERGSQTEGKWEGVPYIWAIGRERAWAKGGEFGARGLQAERIRG